MASDAIERTRWTRLPIVCPHCGNRGRRNGAWMKHSSTPFKYIEDVVRSFEFAAELDFDGTVHLICDVDTDDVFWEASDNPRLECMQCLKEFPIPDESEVDFQ